MTGTKIDGKVVAQAVKDRVKLAVDEIKSQGVEPCLATILVGNNSASAIYVKNKHNACKEVGILTKDHNLSESVTQVSCQQQWRVCCYFIIIMILLLSF